MPPEPRATRLLISSTCVAVRGEMQVGAADSARPHRNQHLAGLGYRVGHVVPVDHPPVAQAPRRASVHRAFLLADMLGDGFHHGLAGPADQLVALAFGPVVR